MINIENIVMGIAVFSSVVLVVFILARYHYLIKKAIAENGGMAASPTNRISYLELGCVVLSLGVGLAVSSVFTEMQISEGTMDLLVWGTIVAFTGGGLMLAQLVRNRANEK
jgi:hypothetical protein